MYLPKTHQKKLFIILPAISIFLVTLIPTLTHSWPLSWDVIYHVLYAKIYSQNGFLLVNPLLNSPIGQKIGYPPLFHFLISTLGKIFNIDPMEIARGIQPILAFFVVLSVTYVAKGFYGIIAGICAGFLMVSSTIIYRIMLPVPENLALIFLPIVVYLYYTYIKEKNVKYVFIAGILLIVIAATHQAALLCLILTITMFTIVELIKYQNKDALKCYGAFLLSLLIMIVIVLVIMLIFKPVLIQSLINQGITATLGFGTSLNYTQPLSFLKYVRNFGLLLTVFSVIGIIFTVQMRRKKDIYILAWIIIMLLLSKAYWIGINVISARLLIYMAIPLSILGGFGVSQIYYKLKDYNNFSSKRVRYAFLICLILFSTLFGVLNASDPNIGSYYAKTVFGSVQIAPPTSSEEDLSHWFKINGDKSKSISISNLYTGVFIAAEAGMPVNYGFTNINNKTPKAYFENNGIEYIVYDKRLTLPPDYNTLNRYQANSEMFPLYYYNRMLYQNIDKLKPNFTHEVYENNDFIVCRIED